MEEQKGPHAAMGLGTGADTSVLTEARVVAGTAWAIASLPGSTIHSPIPQSLLGMIARRRKGTNKSSENVSAIHSLKPRIKVA